jgi:hypothetical protein
VPLVECNIVELDPSASCGAYACPVRVDVEGVRVPMAYKVFEEDVRDCAGPAVRLDHVHLVAGPGVDVTIRDV